MDDTTAVIESPAAAEPAVEVPSLDAPEAPAVETPAAEVDATKVETKPAAGTNANEKPLQALNQHIASLKADPATAALGTQVRAKIVSGLRYEALLKEFHADSLESLRTNMGTNAETAATLESVKASDELLYSADPVLSGNVYSDMKENGCEDKYPAVVANFMEHLAEVNPDAATAMNRSTLLSTLTECGFPELVNKLSNAVYAGDSAKSKSLVQNLIRWFQDESAEHEKQGVRTEATAKANTEAQTKAQTAIRGEIDTEVNTVSNRIFHAAMPVGLSAKISTAQKTALVTAARGAEARVLRADPEFSKEMTKAYNECKTQAQKKAAMQKYEVRITKDVKNIMLEEAKKMFPALMKPAPAVKPPVPSIDTKIGGEVHKVFQIAHRPSEQLIRDDIKVGNRVYTSSDLSLLQLSKQIGVVRTKSGVLSFVHWAS
jgi:hypothetical protein